MYLSKKDYATLTNIANDLANGLRNFDAQWCGLEILKILERLEEQRKHDNEQNKIRNCTMRKTDRLYGIKL